MFRIFLFLVFIALLAAGFSWVADQKGSLTLVFGGQTMELTILQAVIGLIIVVTTLIAGWTLLKTIVTAPTNIATGVRNRRENKSLDALNKGLIAASAGDLKQAHKHAKKASRTLKHQPMSAYLRAQAAQMSGDYAAARRIFEAMLESPDTEIMGLRGLYDEARRVDELIAARQFAERAVHLNPNLNWAIEGLLEIQSRAGEWHAARQTLKLATLNKLLPAKTAQRYRAVLLAAEAMELEVDDAQDALKLALEAHQLAKDLVPAAEVAGRILASQGKENKAANIVAKTWEHSPHPDLALIYAHARPGDSIRDRMKRIKQLAAKHPDHIESAIAVARTAIDGNLWAEARETLEPLLEDNPPARVCTLMAQIEAGEYGDKGRVREWLARAVRAPRDPAWIADGFISEHWLPVSPASGKLDAFVWEVPKESASIHDSHVALENLVSSTAETGGLADLREDESTATASSTEDAPPTHKQAGREDTKVKASKSATSSDVPKEERKAEDAEIIADNPSSSSSPKTTDSRKAKASSDKPEKVTPKTKEGADATDTPDVVNGIAKPSVKLKTGSGSSSAPAREQEQTTFGSKATASAKDVKTPDDKTPVKGKTDKKKSKESVIFVAPRAPDDPGPTSAESEGSAEQKNIAERFRSGN